MFFVMIVIVSVFTLASFYVIRKSVLRTEHQMNEELEQLEQNCQKLLDQKKEVFSARQEQGEKEADIFMLYDITREMAKKNSEEEAFEIFKDKLKDCVTFEKCEFISTQGKEQKEIEELDDHFIFALKGKRRDFGSLAFKGLPDGEKEKAMILSNQFALVLRRIRLYEEIEELATIDSLTNVYTRRYFIERFKEELKRSEARRIEFSLLMMDVDHFKKFNDRYGHFTGDQILKEIGSIIRANIREIDFAGRYGGEEFCVLLPDTDQDGANFAAERIRAAVESAMIQAYDVVVNTTLSIGVVTFPGSGKSVDELIDKADWALYRAKKKGRNCICTFGVYKA